MRSLNLADFLGLTAVLVAPVIGGQWSSWGHCSVTCGVGSQERYFCARPRRICHLRNSRFRDRRRKETRQCTKQNCRAISMSVPMLTGEPSLSRTVQELTPSSQLISSLMSPTLSSVLSSSSASHSSYSDIHSISLSALSSETSSSSLLASALATPSLSTPASSLSSSLLSSMSSPSSPSQSSSPSLSSSPPKPSPTPSLTPSAPATSSLLTPTSSLSSLLLSSSISSSSSSSSLPPSPKPSPTTSLKPSSPNEYYSYFLNHKDVFLSDHVIKILEFKTNIECALACIGTENCRSFNFCPFDKDSQLIGRGHCEINARSHLTSPLNLSAKNGCVYGLPMNLSDEKGDVT